MNKQLNRLLILIVLGVVVMLAVIALTACSTTCDEEEVLFHNIEHNEYYTVAYPVTTCR